MKTFLVALNPEHSKNLTCTEAEEKYNFMIWKRRNSKKKKRTNPFKIFSLQKK